MPDHIMNHLVISGKDYESIMDFRLKYGIHDYFDFNRVIPEPQSIEECDDRYISSKKEQLEDDLFDEVYDWYSWRVDHWGTKWNSYENVIRQYDNILYIKYLTAWETPKQILVKLKEDNKEYRIVNFSHYEFDHHAFLIQELEVKKREDEELQILRLSYNLLKNMDEEHSLLPFLHDKILNYAHKSKDETKEALMQLIGRLRQEYYEEWLKNSDEQINKHKSHDQYMYDKIRLESKQDLLTLIQDEFDLGCVEYTNNERYLK